MLILIICTFLNLFISIQAFLIGSGIWSLIDVSKCDTVVDNVILDVPLEMYKVNYTHVGFRGEIDATMDIDDTFEMLIIVCKHMDGGCKHYVDIKDGMEKLLKKLTEKNLRNLLLSAGIDPPEFPVPQGNRVIENFVMDYCELPTMGCIYGKYEAEAFFMKDEEKVGCLKVVLEYQQPEEEGICE
ncbi:uncharacterized protein LOC112054856 [Bicyclus anynana]|uniref:Uncharacterized protein LOC112054856 n=1 Tax=Bicyclus anynana TaxID=110368 RepID=A0A6J1NS57_BICAN|nr:uncharacterized protein LOC112054856 [Bicyclus anynana]